MNFYNLKQNRCPNCGREFQGEGITQLRVTCLKCGFSITIEEFSRRTAVHTDSVFDEAIQELKREIWGD